jgi:4-hydroxybenzoate polyprenyltransferase
MVDREDDRKIGIRTSAITFGRHDVAAVFASHAVFLLIMAGIGMLFRPGWYFYLGVAVAAILAAVQYPLVRNRDPDGCIRAFRQNNWIGAAIFAGIAAEFYFRNLS